MERDAVSETKVTIVMPMKWPTNGIKPQTKTITASEPEYGIPIIKPIIKMNKAARIAIIPCPPTKEPTLAIIALLNFDTRSRRVAGTNLKLICTT